jgi:hypothetical protein
MGKNRDLVQILALVLIGMFIPFVGSIAITYGLDFTDIDNWLKIGSTFGYVWLIFAGELGLVILYFTISTKLASKKLDKHKSKKD